MMKKCLSLILIAVALVFALPACGTPKAQSVSLWSCPATRKVLRDSDFGVNEKEPAKLDYLLCRGETEGAQIILTPESDVGSFDLEAAPLTCGSQVIPVDQIEILMQHYIEIKRETQSAVDKHDFPLGFWPDALLPLSAAKNKGENRIAAGKNQGLTVNVTTKKETLPGVYTGSFRLTIDGEDHFVPVRAEVADLDISKTHAKSDFVIKKEWLIQGELDNSAEMYRNYYDFLLDYRLSGTDIGVFDTDSDEEYVERLVELYDDDRSGGYQLSSKMVYRQEPSISENEGSQWLMDFDYDILARRLTAIAQKSDETGKNLFSKMHIYMLNADEPQLSERVGVARYLMGRVKQTLREVADSLPESEVYQKSDITELSLVTTTPMLNEQIYPGYNDAIDVFCPEIDNFNYSSARDAYAELAEKDGDENWWYTAWIPFHPLPSYHIDTELLGARVLSWMQYDYGVAGNLYWSTSSYAVAQDSTQGPSKPRDAYRDPIAYTGANANGDGFLTYPGKPYGLERPVSSLRLEAIRDGIEDYELMYLLDEKLNERRESGELPMSAREMLAPIYDRLYSGMTAAFEDDVFASARRELIETVLLVSGEMGGAVQNVSVDEAQNSAKVRVIAAKGVTVSVGGQKLNTAMTSGTGAVIDVDFSENSDLELKFEKGGKSETYRKFISHAFRRTTNFGSDTTAWRKSAGTDGKTDHISIASEEGRLKVVQNAYVPETGKTYDPRLAADINKLFPGRDFSAVREIRFDVSSSAETELEILFVDSSAGREYLVDRFRLVAGENEIRLGKLQMQKFMKYGSMSVMILRFQNLDEGSLTYRFSDFCVDAKELGEVKK